ncbi:MAG: diacylglycerol kinase family protein [Candidatus Promineifilaceae bacterium]
MQATLIFNDSAGTIGRTNVETLLEALQEAGFQPVYTPTQNEEELDPILAATEEAGGLVVSAGGDGTVRAIITRLIGKDIPLSILPLGTANNIAAALGIQGTPLDIIARLQTPRPFSFDVGQLHSPWGTDYFLEGAGFGFFADILTTYEPEKGKSIWRGLQAFTNTLLNGYVHESCLYFNGEELPGNYLLVEVLNTPAIGPRLRFAPNAHPGDGWLDIVCIEASDREGLLRYAASLITEDLEKLETVTVHQAKEMTFTWNGFPLHIDAELRPPHIHDQQATQDSPWGSHPYLPHGSSHTLTIRVIPQAINLWLPPLEETAGS